MCNINARVNKIQKNLLKEVEELVLLNLEELNVKAHEYYQPILTAMQNIVNEVYSTTYMNVDRFEQYSLKLVELSKPLQNRDDVLLQFTEQVVKSNRQILRDILVKLQQQLYELPIPQHRFKLEHKKLQNTAIALQTRYLNDNYKELNRELTAISEYCHDSLIAYGKSPRVIQEINEIEQIAVDLEVVNNNTFKTDKAKDLIELAVNNGYKEVRITGSHHIFKHGNGNIVVIPIHGGKVNMGLSMAIGKQILERSVM